MFNIIEEEAWERTKIYIAPIIINYIIKYKYNVHQSVNNDLLNKIINVLKEYNNHCYSQYDNQNKLYFDFSERFVLGALKIVNDASLNLSRSNNIKPCNANQLPKEYVFIGNEFEIKLKNLQCFPPHELFYVVRNESGLWNDYYANSNGYYCCEMNDKSMDDCSI